MISILFYQKDQFPIVINLQIVLHALLMCRLEESEHTKKECPGYDHNLYLMLILQFGGFKECGILLH